MSRIAISLEITMNSGAALLYLAVAAGRSVFLNLLIAGYFGLMLMLRPEELMHRVLIPLIPLVFLGAGRLAAVAERSYQSEFHPRDYSEVYQAGESRQGFSGQAWDRPLAESRPNHRPPAGQ